MVRDLNIGERTELESMIDKTSLGAILEALSDICGEKAKHIRANWQDNSLAKKWDIACGRIGCMATEKDIITLE